MGSQKKVFSANEVAAACGLRFRTVCRWIRHGHLKIIQLPNGYKGVLASHIASFLRKRGMSVPQVFTKKEPPKACVIEDDKLMANAIERTLLQLGFEVEKFDSGMDAFKEIRQLKPDLITLDLNIKEMQGNEFLKLMNKFNGELKRKIIVISGSNEVEIVQSLQLGSDGFLKKPFRKNDLVYLVSQICDLDSKQPTWEEV